MTDLTPQERAPDGHTSHDCMGIDTQRESQDCPYHLTQTERERAAGAVLIAVERAEAAEAKVAELEDDIKHLPTNQDLADTEQELERIEARLHQVTEALRERQEAIDQAAKVMRESEYVGGPSEREAWKAATLALSAVETELKGTVESATLAGEDE